ncbi:MAG: hypothetical protein KGO96_08735 [Elusimicrobia bacterium]|nr:hypothetical protein [Elusimicrobiota bacterium]MDE2425975.1 hypothetical protein [Elusimicrobiota bacterium]
MSKKFMIPALAAVLLAVAWLLPPLHQTCEHLCPLRRSAVESVQALPSFARKYGVSCSQCHYAFPILNAYGRQFKMNGYVRDKDSDVGVLKSSDKQMSIEKIFPWAVIVRSRPFDNGRGNIANAGGQMGGTASPNTGGFKSQPLNDVDFFVAGGDAARQISYFGEMDANAAGGFAPGLGDLRFGYHPYDQLNVVLARRGFFVDDPYQTLSAAESPTIANRATDLLQPDQSSVAGNSLTGTQQTMYVYGQVPLPNAAFLYYAAGASKDDDLGRQANAPTNGDLRLAFDNNSGLMVGAFGSYGHEGPRDASGFTGGTAGVLSKQQFVWTGFDALWEIGNFAARGAFAYTHEGDPSFDGATATDRAAYAELAYAYKRGNEAYPFLMPLIRENWYTTFNGTQQFNYITFHLAHYFQPNVKAFAEYSVDTTRGYQGGTLTATAGTLAVHGDRASLQVEVGF